MHSKLSINIKSFGVGLAALLTAFSPITVNAAQSSGKTSGSITNTIQTSACTGTQKVSGMDASVFAQITPDHAGTIVCSKSDGFKTAVTGSDDVNNVHWVAWYKEKLKDEIDHTQTNGNYFGFPKDKVIAWKEYEDEIRELNNGKFPEVKDYVYPTDTSTGKLDFWGDKAGYYSILGDPRYANIRMQSYQQFSYRVERVETSYSIWTDPNYVPPDTGGDKGNGGGNHTSKPHKPNKPDKPQETCETRGDCPKPPKYDWSTCGAFICDNGAQSPDYGVPGSKPNSNKDKGSASNTTKPQTSSPSFAGGNGNHAKSSQVTYNLGNGRYQTVTTTVYSYNETKQVKVADASVAGNAYATEIAAYGLLNLIPGAASTKQYDVGTGGFWKTKPSYWTDGGKLTIYNNGSYPYGFVDARENNNGVNKVNLYKFITQKDKLYDVIHGYKKLPPDVCKGKCKPSGEDSDPLTEIEINIDKDEPQDETELKKFVHLDKNPDEWK